LITVSTSAAPKRPLAPEEAGNFGRVAGCQGDNGLGLQLLINVQSENKQIFARNVQVRVQRLGVLMPQDNTKPKRALLVRSGTVSRHDPFQPRLHIETDSNIYLFEHRT
jgi:hypothetical protein